MRRSRLALVLAMCVFAPNAYGAGGINFTANTCAGAGGANNLSFACNVNTGSLVFYGSVLTPAPMPKFIGVQTVVDVQVGAAVLPNWWLVQTGGCRPSAIAQDYAPADMDGACFDIWQSINPLAVSTVQIAVGGPNRLRINGGAAIANAQAFPIPVDGTEWNVYRVVISRTKSTGVGSCPGCSIGACLVLNEIQLVQPAGFPVYRLSNPLFGNYVVYNPAGGAPACPGIVATQNRSWGAIKSLYR